MDFERNNVPDGSDDENIIEGGEIKGISGAGYKVDPLKGHRATTARTLAYGLLIILAISIVAHYGITAWLLASDRLDAVDKLQGIYTTWLPVISGLAGSAVTYFFTKED